MEVETKVQAYRVHKECPNCKTGFMVSTGEGVTRFKTTWRHKCNQCGNFEDYVDVTYPHIIYKTKSEERK